MHFSRYILCMHQPRALPSASVDRVTLVIDDSPTMRKLVRHMLYQVGLRDHVHDASSADCLPLLRRYKPRLIILSWDIEGPGSSNLVSFFRNPAFSSGANTPILATIERPTLRNIRMMQSLGIRACLKKPFSLRALRERVAALVSMVQTDDAEIIVRPRPRLASAAVEIGRAHV